MDCYYASGTGKETERSTVVIPLVKFTVPDWGDKVDSGIGFSYRPARLHRMEGRYDHRYKQPYAGVIQGI